MPVRTIELYDYQKEAVDFLRVHSRAILGDEQGVGKSYPAIAAFDYLDGPKLIVSPSYLMYNWYRYLREMGHRDIAIVEGERHQRYEALRSDAEWYLLNYEMLSRTIAKPNPRTNWGPEYVKELLERPWAGIIFDEAHKLRGRNTGWTSATFKMLTLKYAPSRDARVILVTGTPIYNNPGDVWSYLKIIDPRTYTSYWRFVETYCWMEYNGWAMDVVGVRDPEGYRGTLDQYMIRRKLRDVYPELDEPVHHLVHLQLPQRWMDAHKQAKQKWILENPDTGEKKKLLELTSQLRRLTGAMAPTKKAALKDFLSDHDAEQVVVWAWYHDSINAAESVVPKKRLIGVATGDTAPRDRDKLVEKLSSSKDGVLIASLGALQMGANIQSAHTMVFYEEDYLHTTNDQALGRLNRRGQTEQVHVYHFLCEGTIDDNVHQIAKTRELVTGRALRELLIEDFKL